jgi:integrase
LIRLALEVLQRRAAGVAAPAITVAQIYDRYRATNRARPGWWSTEDKLAGVVAALGAREVLSLRVLDWTDYRADREQQEIQSRPGRTRKASTINIELGAFKALLNWGVKQGRLSHNPLAAAARVKTRRHRETAPREPDIAELLLEADPRQRVVILCAVDAGMRRSEIRSLSWDWIDRDARVIRLADWACKNKRGGPVPATSRLLAAIDAVPRHLRSPYVLTSARGGRFNPRTLTRWWQAAAEAAGLVAAPGDGRVTLHDGRHSYASNATRRGVRIEIVSQVLRHASLDQTRDYVQTCDADLTAARETFEAGIVRDQGKSTN